MTKSAKTLMLLAAAFTAGVGTPVPERRPNPEHIPVLLRRLRQSSGAPLTPMSYAGVARRTVRRCAVGVYYC